MSLETLLSRLKLKLAALARFLEPSVLATVLLGENPRTYIALTRPWLRTLGIRTVIDIGANQGQFAQTAMRAYPSAHIYCFEPLVGCFETLRRRIGGRPHVSLSNVALADRAGQATMVRNPFSPSSSLLEMTALHERAFPFTAGGEQVRIPVSTLDAELSMVTLQEPMLVKIDVQGFEGRVIEGGRATLGRAAVAIVETSYEVLYRDQPLFDEINSLMRGLGFRYHGNIGELRSPIDGQVLQTDSVFVRADGGPNRANRS